MSRENRVKLKQFQPKRDSVSDESNSNSEGDENMLTHKDQQAARLDYLDW